VCAFGEIQEIVLHRMPVDVPDQRGVADAFQIVPKRSADFQI
jgi:hypothetical protein